LSGKIDLDNLVSESLAKVNPKEPAKTPAPAAVVPPPNPAPPPSPPKEPSKALLALAAEALVAADAYREAEGKVKALRIELFEAMKKEGVDEIPVAGREGPIKIERGEKCEAPSQTILKEKLSAADAEMVWQATKKKYERLATLPKPEEVAK
jgi:hypothetical protein